MVNVTGQRDSLNGLNNSAGDFYEKNRKKVETYSVILLFCLITAVLLISFNQRLLAGCFVIAAASLGVIIVRKSTEINKRIQDSLSEFSNLNSKKDDLITDFSHRIREPLNNLVIIADILRESGLQKKQKELLETFIASTIIWLP
jgi:signal transduction histidine kinase